MTASPAEGVGSANICLRSIEVSSYRQDGFTHQSMMLCCRRRYLPLAEGGGQVLDVSPTRRQWAVIAQHASNALVVGLRYDHHHIAFELPEQLLVFRKANGFSLALVEVQA